MVPIMVAIIRTKAAFRSSVMLLYFPVAYPSLTRWMQAKASGMASPCRSHVSRPAQGTIRNPNAPNEHARARNGESTNLQRAR